MAQLATAAPGLHKKGCLVRCCLGGRARMTSCSPPPARAPRPLARSRCCCRRRRFCAPLGLFRASRRVSIGLWVYLGLARRPLGLFRASRRVSVGLWVYLGLPSASGLFSASRRVLPVGLWVYFYFEPAVAPPSPALAPPSLLCVAGAGR